METANNEKINLIDKVNNIIHKQSKLRDASNLKELESLGNEHYDFLTIEENKIFKQLINALSEFYVKDAIHNPKLMSDRFFENVRVQMLKNETEKDIRSDGTMSEDLKKVIEEETGENIQLQSEDESLDSSVKKDDGNEKLAEETTIQDKDSISKDVSEEVSQDGKSKSESEAHSEVSSDDLDKSHSKLLSVKENIQNVKTDNLKTSSNDEFQSKLNDLNNYYQETLEKANKGCQLSIDASIQKVDCSNKEEADKIKKEVVDDFGIFLNKTFDEEMTKLSTWEDKADAERFRNYYQMYNLKMVNYLIHKYNME